MRLAHPEELTYVTQLLRGHFPYIKFSVKDLRRKKVYVWDVLYTMEADREVYVIGGYVILDTKPDDEVIQGHKDSWFLHYIGIKNKYRGEGIGQALLSEIKKELGDKPIYTYVAAFNKKALNLFVSQGFRVQREVIKYGQSWLEMLWRP
jgi:ribosomal protein S18 acetylase RimI-like enzyme